MEGRMLRVEIGTCLALAATVVPGARIELATPAFSGRRSTSELPRHANNFSSLGARRHGVNSPVHHFFSPNFETRCSITPANSKSSPAGVRQEWPAMPLSGSCKKAKTENTGESTIRTEPSLCKIHLQGVREI